ncbi:MAG TPA: hypothetical protein VJN71_03445 [Nitrososphaerales archaeon]|nr:hypothetical protein [Nitrososphaerales archaeon]
MAFGTARTEVGLLILLIMGFLFHFAAVQFVALVLIGFFVAKLSFYRFANAFLKVGMTK